MRLLLPLLLLRLSPPPPPPSSSLAAATSSSSETRASPGSWCSGFHRPLNKFWSNHVFALLLTYTRSRIHTTPPKLLRLALVPVPPAKARAGAGQVWQGGCLPPCPGFVHNGLYRKTWVGPLLLGTEQGWASSGSLAFRACHFFNRLPSSQDQGHGSRGCRDLSQSRVWRHLSLLITSPALFHS